MLPPTVVSVIIMDEAPCGGCEQAVARLIRARQRHVLWPHGMMRWIKEKFNRDAAIHLPVSGIAIHDRPGVRAWLRVVIQTADSTGIEIPLCLRSSWPSALFYIIHFTCSIFTVWSRRSELGTPSALWTAKHGPMKATCFESTSVCFAVRWIRCFSYAPAGGALHFRAVCSILVDVISQGISSNLPKPLTWAQKWID